MAAFTEAQPIIGGGGLMALAKGHHRDPGFLEEWLSQCDVLYVDGHEVEASTVALQLARERGKPVPMNIDGATAVIYAELGFAAPLARGLFCLSRSVGILAHAWEQQQQGGRNKGPTPPGYRWTYTGPAKG